ncbi:hypothetical protein D3C87_2119370 [compost metagenome]
MVPFAPAMAGEGAQQQVVGHAHAGEQLAFLRHQAQPARDHHFNLRHRFQAAVEVDLAA